MYESTMAFSNLDNDRFEADQNLLDVKCIQMCLDVEFNIFIMGVPQFHISLD